MNERVLVDTKYHDRFRGTRRNCVHALFSSSYSNSFYFSASRLLEKYVVFIHLKNVYANFEINQAYNTHNYKVFVIKHNYNYITLDYA